jgi:hypothetical protein
MSNPAPVSCPTVAPCWLRTTCVSLWFSTSGSLPRSPSTMSCCTVKARAWSAAAASVAAAWLPDAALQRCVRGGSLPGISRAPQSAGV